MCVFSVFIETLNSRTAPQVVCDSPAALTQPRPNRDASLTTVRARSTNLRRMSCPL
jgi:hypothetical protein